MTTFDRFKALAQRGGLVPVWRDCLLDAETPVSAFAKLRRGPFAFLLESAPAGGETWARYTFMGTEPRARVASERRRRGGLDARRRVGTARARPPIRWPTCSALVAKHEPVDVPELGAFWSGAVGFFSYDIARHIERLPNAPPRTIAAPDALFVFTHALVIIDALRSQARVVVGRAGERRARATRELQRAARRCDARHRCDHCATARAGKSRAARSRSRIAAGHGHLRVLARQLRAGRRAHSRVHLRRRLFPGAPRSAHPGAARFRARRRSIARCARSIRRPTCITSCSMDSSSWAARPSCSCALPADA